MFDVRNVYNLIKLRFKIFLVNLSFTNISFWIGITGTVFSMFFLFVTLSVVISYDKTFLVPVSLLMPLLLHLSLAQRNYIDANNIDKTNKGSIINFLKTLRISFFDRVVFYFLNEALFSIKFWIGFIFLILFWLIFGKFNLLVLYFIITTYLSAYFFLIFLFINVNILLIGNKMVRLLGFLINLILNIVPLVIFFSLFTIINSQIRSSFALTLFSKLKFLNSILNIKGLFFLLFLTITLLGLILLSRYFLERRLYFKESDQKKNKTLNTNASRNISFLDFILSGVFSKDIKWLTKFTNIFFNFLYPLIFMVFIVKVVFDSGYLWNGSLFRNLYLVLSLANFSFITDNQLSIYSKYFLFDLTNKINIRLYFISKFIISFIIFVFVGVIFFLLNKYLALGYQLDLNLLVAFAFYLILLNIKGIIFSIYDYKPMVYNENQIKQSNSSFASGCFMSILNMFILTPLYILIVLKLPMLLISLIVIAALLFYIILVYFSNEMFKHQYFKITQMLIGE